jgi:beta-lactam-binding protein with PASTA domain/tRNA A-37 threonylcarbamoyl transferase component Bud32
VSVTVPALGQLLDGRYRIGDLIARGGMARVFEAVDTRLDRSVAIKVLDPELARDPDFEARFVREARSAARLSHPHVVAVFDQGRDGDLLYLVMERIVGPTLRQVLRADGPFDLDRALVVVAEVCSALQAAHAAGLVHRDVKPENVLLGTDANGQQIVKVTDFGLARAVSDTTSTTRGVVLGTVSYLAPEQVSTGRVDERTDVYAAGILLFELVTGKRPYSGDNPLQVAYQHVNSDVPAPSTVAPGIPAEVDAIVRHATRRDPSDRFASVLRFGDELRALTAARADRRAAPDQHTREVIADTLSEGSAPPLALSSAVPPPAAAAATARTRPPRRRSRRRLVAVLVAALVLALAGAGYYVAVAQYTQAPELTGMTMAQAQDEAAKSGLSIVEAGKDFSETAPVGSIVDATPGTGDRIHDGGTIDVVLSKGPERFDVPKLVGRTVDEARAALTGTSLGLGNQTTAFSESIPAGRIVSSDPDIGTPLPRDKTVNVVVSKGRQPIDVPSVTGKTEAVATKAITGARLGVDRTDAFSDTVAAGSVISQDPKSGTLFRNDKVRIVVSKGPEMIVVPRVRGQSLTSAQRELAAAGFKVKVVHSTFYFGSRLVIGESPGGGKKARKGSTITLTIV